MISVITGDGRIHVLYYRGYMYVYSQNADGFFGNICWVADALKVCNADESDMKVQFEKLIDMMLEDEHRG